MSVAPPSGSCRLGEPFRTVKCSTRGPSLGNLWRRFEQNEERNEPPFPPRAGGGETPGSTGWKEDDRGEGSDVVNAERFRECNNATRGFFVASNLRIRARGIERDLGLVNASVWLRVHRFTLSFPARFISVAARARARARFCGLLITPRN